MKPLSNDLRQRILGAVNNKEDSRRELAARFAVNNLDDRPAAPL